MQKFDTVFDFAKAGYQDWLFPVGGLLFVLLGGLQLVAPKIGRPLYPGVFTVLLPEPACVIAMAFGFAWTVSVGSFTFLQYLDLKNALVDGQFDRVEGTIKNFRLFPAKKLESFDVGEVTFSFVPQFNERIHEGSVVRISQKGGVILRVEVAE